jgi:steroid delta-isomerase-like uncharacterized protein
MSAEDNKRLVRHYLAEVWEKGNLAVMDQLLAPNYRRYLNPRMAPLDAAAQRQRLAGFLAAFPDVALTVEDLMADGDRVIFRATIRGTHLGPFQGIAPTGKAVTAMLLDVVRVEDGRLVEHWGGPDMLDILQQLGARIAHGD